MDVRNEAANSKSCRRMVCQDKTVNHKLTNKDFDDWKRYYSRENHPPQIDPSTWQHRKTTRQQENMVTPATARFADECLNYKNLVVSTRNGGETCQIDDIPDPAENKRNLENLNQQKMADDAAREIAQEIAEEDNARDTLRKKAWRYEMDAETDAETDAEMDAETDTETDAEMDAEMDAVMAAREEIRRVGVDHDLEKLLALLFVRR